MNGDDDDVVFIRRSEAERWCRKVLREIEGLDDDEIVPGHWDLEGEPLTVREVRERTRGALTQLVVERRLQGLT